jgi:D-ribose pyranase
VKRGGILHPELLAVIARLGHTDRLVIADSGLPIPPSVTRVDLALVAGVPSFLQTLEAVLHELAVEGAVVAEEMGTRSPHVLEAVRRLLGAVPLTFVPHEAFKAQLPAARAVVRTGEQTPYANIILIAGVTF